jgi:hypothetical protein
MPFIRESIVTTLNADGSAHIAPLGLIEQPPYLVIAPFHPSRTLDNLHRDPVACVSYTTDVRVFAGCVSKRWTEWPVVKTERLPGWRLADCLAHAELEVIETIENLQRPRFVCSVAHERSHAPFRGFNRAQAAVVEAAILVSRLHMLTREKVQAEMAYLRIAIDKTAGDAEREAWEWLADTVERALP